MSGWNSTGQQDYEYGSWSGWTQTAIKQSSGIEVETQMGYKEVPRTVYNYKRYHYFNTDNNRWYNTYGDYQPGYKDESKNNEWQYKTTSKPLAKVAVYSGNQMYAGEWFDEEISTEYDYVDVTEYRSRTVTPVYGFWRWGTSWSSWFDGYTDANSETQTEYRYRYKLWEGSQSDWSQWSDAQANAQRGREVDERTMFRYRERGV